MADSGGVSYVLGRMAYHVNKETDTGTMKLESMFLDLGGKLEGEFDRTEFEEGMEYEYASHGIDPEGDEALDEIVECSAEYEDLWGR